MGFAKSLIAKPREVVANHKAQLHNIDKECTSLNLVMADLQAKLQELADKVTALANRADQEAKDAGEIDEGVSYLAIKQQMLGFYCLDLCLYTAMKLSGASVAEHGIGWQMLELRTILEKLRPVDSKLKYQIDKLLRLATTGGEVAGDDPLSYRPNPDALLGKDGEDEGGVDEDEDPLKDSGGLYRAPRLASMPYDEDQPLPGQRDARKDERRADKLRRSEILETLKEEFGDRPTVVRPDAGRLLSDSYKRKAQAEDRERQQFEEDHMIRLTMSKKLKKQRREQELRHSRLETIADVGNIGDFMRLSRSSPGESGDPGGPRQKQARGGAEAGGALDLAMGAVGRSMGTPRRKKSRRN